ncbi:hypothetical protein AVEN_230715-1 [Araneus ventricosus]|uniref:Uncharacterized protein n=1 Tax=Araneus ventricosus TaxID=182803 RepID=A0A4Y2A1S6_ARAVE|nr:hypothetical protein AVEN_230715-1 [Araneus ventricosus]
MGIGHFQGETAHICVSLRGKPGRPAAAGEGAVILTGIVKPRDEGGISASIPSSSTSLDTLKVEGADSVSISDTNITRKSASDNNLKISSSLGNNLQQTSKIKSLTVGKFKTKDMAPTSKNPEKDVGEIFTCIAFSSTLQLKKRLTANSLLLESFICFVICKLHLRDIQVAGWTRA